MSLLLRLTTKFENFKIETLYLRQSCRNFIMRSHLMGRIVVTPNVVNPQANGINYIIIIIKVQ